MQSSPTRHALIAIAGGAVGLLALTACADSSPGDADGDSEFTLLLATSQSEHAPIVQGFNQWAEAVYEETDGGLTIEIHTSGALGSDDDVIEQALQGSNVAVGTDPGRMSNYVPDIGILGMPYIVESYDELAAITDTDTFASMDADFEDHGIKILAYNWYDGPRNFYTNQLVETPTDLNGLRIRTPGDPVWSESVRALGAEPTAIPWADTYNALQSGAVDGLEAQTAATSSSSMHEVVSNMARTEHFHLAQFIMTGQSWFDTLPEDYQTVLVDQAREIGVVNAQLILEETERLEAEMVDAGLAINEPDKTPFIEASEAAYQKLDFEDLRDQLWQEIGKQQ